MIDVSAQSEEPASENGPSVARNIAVDEVLTIFRSKLLSFNMCGKCGCKSTYKKSRELSAALFPVL